MTQADRDRLVTLRKAKKRLITQRQAAEELGLSVRQVKRLLYALKKRGDRAVIPTGSTATVSFVRTTRISKSVGRARHRDTDLIGGFV